jgi:hypothetical protein
MNRLLILPVLLLTLLVGTPAFSADFQKGLAAYESGDYATALREWKSIEKQRTVIFVGGISYAKIDSEKIIEHCWAISQHKLDTGITSEMINGTGDVIDCLEGAIVENMIALVGVKRRDEIKKRVNEFSSAVGNLNYPINNEQKDCVPLCGTMYRVTNMGVIAEFLGEMLKNVINARNENEL